MTVDSVEGVVFELWDVGVTEKTRNRLVHHYSENTKGIYSVNKVYILTHVLLDMGWIYYF